eukprot:TRINITY_DN76389_c0_g1_i1.p1 TRINITY_DN76389_c0_g1~~TRINITY_DN76389_c0_g1_i1.p1  ORF type:complete len:211 (-),score=19.36 TRINITY_DN76389_c0_g1_i1:72-680(-)
MREYKEGEAIDMKEEVIIHTGDGKEYVITRAIAKQSTLLRDMLADNEPADGEPPEEETRIPLTNIHSDALKHIVEYMEHHVDKQPQQLTKPLRKPLPELLHPWEKNFLYGNVLPLENPEENWEVLHDVVMGADFMGIESLRDLCSAAIANMISKRSLPQLKKIFGVKGDITSAMVEEVVSKYPFLKEKRERAESVVKNNVSL